MIKEKLVQLGLTENEAKTYTYLLDKHKAKAAEVAKYLDVTHPAIKKILDGLINRELVRAQAYGKTVYYFAESGDNIIEMVSNETDKIREEQREKMESAEELSKLVEGKALLEKDVTTDVRYYTGKSGVDEVALQVSRAKDKKILEFFDKDLVFYGKAKDKEQHKKLFESNKIEFESIYTGQTEGENDTINTDKMIKLSKEKVFFPEAEMLIYDDKVAFNYPNKGMNTIIIKNKWIVNTLKTLHTNLKSELKKDT